MNRAVRRGEVDQAIYQRIRMHGWVWPRGTTATVASSLGVSHQRVSDRRLDLLIKAIKEFP